jgi:hypothetical protein
MDEGDGRLGGSRWLARLAREPLLHFAAIGAALFVLFAAFGRDPAATDRRVVVSAGTVAHLTAVFERTWQRPPSPAELEGLVADHVREELLVREAIALGLDRDDVIVRRRLRQKLELLAEGLGRGAEPRDEELAAFLAAHADRYRVEPRVTFRQHYVSRDRRGAAAEADAARLLLQLRAGEAGDAARLADPLPLPAVLRDVPLSEVGRRFGEPFAARLAELAVGEWSGPIESGYGPHVVLVEARSDGRPPALDEVREAVLRDWRTAQAEAAVEELVRTLRAGSEVIVEEPAIVPGVARAEQAP